MCKALVEGRKNDAWRQKEAIEEQRKAYSDKKAENTRIFNMKHHVIKNKAFKDRVNDKEMTKYDRCYSLSVISKK